MKPKLPSEEVKSMNGWYRICCGKFKRLNGKMVPARFFTSKNKVKHLKAALAIRTRWAELEAQGHTFWPEGDLIYMEQQRVISKRKSNIDIQDAKKLLQDFSANTMQTCDPMTKTELEPFMNADGTVRNDSTPQVLDVLSRKIFGNLDVRCAFFNNLYADALRDPLGTFERCNRIFGWSTDETSRMLFNFQGMSVTPVAYNAATNTGPSSLEQELEDDNDNDNVIEGTTGEAVETEDTNQD